ncbi:MAG TPA: tetratricopeptide repeat protein [Gemmatimonadaceae bacterium]|nr:tetratricopeptide repeat protein [Gemmatimonadaceae bacterium]
MPTVMPLLGPVQAFAQDLEGVHRSTFGAADSEWLLLAALLHRLAAVRPADRERLGSQLASTFRESDGDLDVPRAWGNSEHERASLAKALSTLGTAESAERIATFAMTRAASMENAGAFRLAYATLTCLHLALPNLADGARGLVIAQQGRVARQFGDVRLAREHYEEALRLGRSARAPEVAVRALLGLGVLANTRGNYPDARRLFRSALRRANTPSLAAHAAAAHHGLMLGSLAAWDLEGALAHGWAAFQSAGNDADRRADELINLAEICLRGGEYHAALNGYRVALRLTSLARLRLAALGGAVLAATRAKKHADLVRLAHDAEVEIARAQQPFESAQTLIELAEAFEMAGATDRAASYRDRAAETAERGGFYEVIHRADSVAARLVARTESSRLKLGQRSSRIVRAIEALPIDEPTSVARG